MLSILSSCTYHDISVANDTVYYEKLNYRCCLRLSGACSKNDIKYGIAMLVPIVLVQDPMLCSSICILYLVLIVYLIVLCAHWGKK